MSEKLHTVDERWMSRALEVGRRGRPSPNPHVGAVVLSSAGDVVGEGHHEAAGGDLAEVVAL